MITRELCKEFRDDLAKAVKELEAKYHATIELGTISFADSKLTARLTFTECNETGEKIISAQDNCKANYTAQAHGLRFSGDFIGSTWTNNTDTLKITGYRPKAKKYPFIAEYTNKSAKPVCLPGEYLADWIQVVKLHI